MKLRYFLIVVAMLPMPAQQAAADKAEDAATAECKAKSDPSILVNYWKTIAAPASPAALADLESRARTICVARGGGGSRSFRIAGNAGPMKVSGTACDLAKPFTVSGSGGGMKVTFSYAPASGTAGKVSYTGGGPGAPMAGAGTYAVTLDDKGGTIKQTHTGKVTIPFGGSATNTDILKLTPIPPC
ncbi:MAG TPA: hypothetical protein VN655_09695 [Pseudolabrys sp.]|nr:hypothetical protein [Pseudolabrys sp.]